MNTKKLNFTPSLFYQYSICPHWIWFDIYGDPAKKSPVSEFSTRLREEGVLHEENYIKDLKFVKVEPIDIPQAIAETLELMRKGTPLIYQGTIETEINGVTHRGRLDLLEKREGKSNFGNWFYAPVDIKSGRELKAPYLMQLIFYGLALQQIQGIFPDEIGIINRDFQRLRHSVTELDKDKTKKQIADILDVMNGKRPSLTLTSSCRDTNPWHQECLKEAVEKNDLALIYNFNSRAFEDLRANGIHTVNDLASADIMNLPKIRFASPDTLKKKQIQAKSLTEKKIIRMADVSIDDAPVKLYFDIEGDPFLNVEYLFGFWVIENGKEPFYKHFLAEKPEDEGIMWQGFLLWVKSLPQNYKVYHYHHYETTKLKQLGERYSRIEELDYFEHNMIDLAKIVQESVIFPVYFYSIKDIAKYLGFKWRHEK
ncbi:MAG: TM0106 family RecB-like putative nuclease, partial [bacterium]|nr:TM0106 family RecB-like putative nuclease [bacterium]